MWLWCWGDTRALASVGFSPTAIPKQPGVEPDSYRLVVGAVLSPGGQFAGVTLSPVGSVVGSNALTHGVLCGGDADAQPQGAVCGANSPMELFVGVMLGPMGLVVGAMLSPGGLFVGPTVP